MESWLWNPGCGVLAVEFWLWNPGCGHLVGSWAMATLPGLAGHGFLRLSGLNLEGLWRLRWPEAGHGAIWPV